MSRLWEIDMMVIGTAAKGWAALAPVRLSLVIMSAHFGPFQAILGHFPIFWFRRRHLGVLTAIKHISYPRFASAFAPFDCGMVGGGLWMRVGFVAAIIDTRSHFCFFCCFCFRLSNIHPLFYWFPLLPLLVSSWHSHLCFRFSIHYPQSNSFF